MSIVVVLIILLIIVTYFAIMVSCSLKEGWKKDDFFCNGIFIY